MRLQPTPEASPALAAIKRLQRVQAALAAGEPVDRDDGEWLAGRFAHYLAAAPTGVDLDAAFGLRVAPGATPWWRAATHHARDEAIRELVRNIAGKPNGQAVELRTRMDRYAGSSWPRDRVSKTPTAANELLFRIFSLDPNPPTSIRQLTAIITG